MGEPQDRFELDLARGERFAEPDAALVVAGGAFATGAAFAGGPLPGELAFALDRPLATNAARCSPVRVDFAATRSAGVPSNTSRPPS